MIILSIKNKLHTQILAVGKCKDKWFGSGFSGSMNGDRRMKKMVLLLALVSTSMAYADFDKGFH